MKRIKRNTNIKISAKATRKAKRKALRNALRNTESNRRARMIMKRAKVEVTKNTKVINHRITSTGHYGLTSKMVATV